jgi:GNAT superfamily N-acetyltransferase
MAFKIAKIVKPSKVVKLELKDGKKTVGRVYLYVIKNDLHKKPYGLMEDLYVDESIRGQGLGKKLLELIIAEAKKKKLYKLIGTSRLSRKNVHSFYQKYGFKKYGLEFRLDL